MGSPCHAYHAIHASQAQQSSNKIARHLDYWALAAAHSMSSFSSCFQILQACETAQGADWLHSDILAKYDQIAFLKSSIVAHIVNFVNSDEPPNCLPRPSSSTIPFICPYHSDEPIFGSSFCCYKLLGIESHCLTTFACFCRLMQVAQSKWSLCIPSLHNRLVVGSCSSRISSNMTWIDWLQGRWEHINDSLQVELEKWWEYLWSSPSWACR